MLIVKNRYAVPIVCLTYLPLALWLFPFHLYQWKGTGLVLLALTRFRTVDLNCFRLESVRLHPVKSLLLIGNFFLWAAILYHTTPSLTDSEPAYIIKWFSYFAAVFFMDWLAWKWPWNLEVQIVSPKWAAASPKKLPDTSASRLRGLKEPLSDASQKAPASDDGALSPIGPGAGPAPGDGLSDSPHSLSFWRTLLRGGIVRRETVPSTAVFDLESESGDSDSSVSFLY